MRVLFPISLPGVNTVASFSFRFHLMYVYILLSGSRDSAVGIGTCYRLDDREVSVKESR
jgi:hypothetical protein